MQPWYANFFENALTVQFDHRMLAYLIAIWAMIHFLALRQSTDGFKTIFWWEWSHRFLGRFIGLVFLVPFLYFWARGMIRSGYMPKLMSLFVLGGLQGVLGWYMVKSGLVDRVDVSQYRLAAHLGLAVLIFGFAFWWALDLRRAPHRDADLDISGLKASALALVALVFVQIILGAFVAGMDAGLAHNTRPLMDGEFIPSGLAIMQPWYVNFFDNALTVQFDHRMLAYLIAIWALIHFFALRQSTELIEIRTGARMLLAIVGAQIALGIATLLMHVPFSLALAHQALAIATFAVAIYHLRRVHDLSLRPSI